jgi:PST family polysaccharide transporter
VVGTFLGATGVGFVAFGQRLVETVAFAKRGAYRLGMVAMSRVGNDEEGRLRYSVEEGSLLQLLALAIPIAAFGIAARWLVPVAFGHEWVKALPVYSLLALATVLGASGFIQTAYLYSRGRNMAVTGAAAIQSVVLAGVAAVLVKPIGLEGYGVAWIASLVWLLYADRAVRKMFSFSYRRILPWVIALGPAALFPLPPLPWAYLLLAPLLLMLTPTMRGEIHRLVELIRSSLSRHELVPSADAVAGPTP